MVEVAAAEACAVSAVQATHESKLPYYGVAGGRLAENRKGLYLISEVLEKPAPTVAEQRLIVPGLRAGHYLCFFGMHVLTPAVMDLLGADMAAGQTASLSQTLAQLANRERYLACELQGRRFDIGLKYGLLTAQLALALSSPARAEVLAGLVELLAQEGLIVRTDATRHAHGQPAPRNHHLGGCRTSATSRLTPSAPAPRRTELLAACAELEAFRRRSDNLYERVRALFFLYAIHRFHLPGKLPAAADGHDSVQGI